MEGKDRPGKEIDRLGDQWGNDCPRERNISDDDGAKNTYINDQIALIWKEQEGDDPIKILDTETGCDDEKQYDCEI